MASISKIDGKWQYRVSYKSNEIDKEGKAKYKTKSKSGFRTKREAQIAAAELEDRLDKGHQANSGEQQFSLYMRNWFELYKKGKYSKGHEENIERSVKLVEQHFLGVKLKDLNREIYQKFINEISPNYAPDTVRKRHIYIKACLRDAIQDGVIFKDPTYKIIITGANKSKKEELKYLNFIDLQKLVTETKKDLKPRYISRYIILFAVSTGARFSEIMGMTWDCIDFENRMITINKTWDFKYSHNFSDTKNYQSKRTITIDNDICEILQDLKATQEKLSSKTKLKNKKNLCFINLKMTLISNNAVNKTLKNLCEKVKVKEITLHGLRHTHASLLLYRGVNIKYISRRLGHNDIVTTLQTYSHILDEMEQKESRLVDITMSEIFKE